MRVRAIQRAGAFPTRAVDPPDDAAVVGGTVDTGGTAPEASGGVGGAGGATTPFEPLVAFWGHGGSSDMEKIGPLLRVADYQP